MAQLSDQGRQLVEELSARHGFGSEAVGHLLQALAAGGGSQAQFNHWEFGGMGQWSLGGMVMIGDMFNNGLKARVDALCNDLSGSMARIQVYAPPPERHGDGDGGQSQSQSPGQFQTQSPGQSQSQSSGASLFVSGGSRWPAALGQPASQGSQNQMHYAYFPQARRLAITVHGQTTLYDTMDHQIGGFGQAQSGDQSLTFTSQHGVVRVADLPQVPEPEAKTSDDNVPGQQPPEDTPLETAAPAPQETDPQEHSSDVGRPEENRSQVSAPEDNPPEGPRAATDTAPPADAVHGEPSKSGGLDIIATIQKLGELHAAGILTDQEFHTKKSELLARL